MSSCRSSFVSILNNDDNPAFAVRSTYGIPTHYPTSSQYQLEPPSAKSTSEYHYGRTYSDSPSPRVMRQAFDPVTEATRAASPGSSDCSSYDYTASSGTGSYYHPYARHDPYAYHPRPDKRLSGNSMAEPPSPQTSIASTSKESVGAKPARKNKYPCPFAASHACTATLPDLQQGVHPEGQHETAYPDASDTFRRNVC